METETKLNMEDCIARYQRGFIPALKKSPDESDQAFKERMEQERMIWTRCAKNLAQYAAHFLGRSI